MPSVFMAALDKNVQREKNVDGPAAAAKAYVKDHRKIYDLSEVAADTAEVSKVFSTDGGSTVVQMKQRVDGFEVYDTQMALMLDKDHNLVAITGSLHPDGRAGASQSAAVKLSEKDAVALAFADVVGESLPSDRLQVDADTQTKANSASVNLLAGQGGSVNYVFARPATVTSIMYPLTRTLLRAYKVEIEIAPVDIPTSRAYEYVIAAGDGTILERRNRTMSHSYRVWADSTGEKRPLDGPQGDVTPHVVGSSIDTSEKPVVDRNLINMDGFNTNLSGQSDPWLAANATETSGNNVDAYVDHQSPDGFTDGDRRGRVSSAGTFDWPFNPNEAPNEADTQINASVAQIFYVTNWLHDYYYDAGFTEAAGNAQVNNFGRGGAEGDPLLVEAQDTNGEQRNNANMSTLGDGASPRMQMYLWDGVLTPIGETSLIVLPPSAIAGDYEAQGATFGVDDLVSASSDLVQAFDIGGDAGVKEDGCEEFTSNVQGKIAMVDRGSCPFVQKAENAVKAQAAGLIIVNNDTADGDALPPLGGDEDSIEIPVVGISLNTGAKFKSALASEADDIAINVTREGRERGPYKDGTLDNSIVAHEWGHYLHHRLSECNGTVQCGGMSEGWGDYVALAMQLREGDNLDGAFADATYASGNNFFGIRRVTYSTDMSLNALTFKHVANGEELPGADVAPIQPFGPNSEVHNAGEIWATALWEVHIAITKESQGPNPRFTFAESQRRIAQYMVAGLLAAPTNATMTEMRDSLLAAAAATDKRDLKIMADAFAKRGFGTGAISPERASEELMGISESYKIGGELQVASVKLETIGDCDNDSHLDAGETALVTIEVLNSGPVALDNTEVTIDEVEGLAFVGASSIKIERLEPLSSKTVTLEVELDSSLSDTEELAVKAVSSNADAVFENVDSTLVARVNYDSLKSTSKDDDVESDASPWNVKTEFADGHEWERKQFKAPNMVWHADDIDGRGDQLLESPALKVGKEPFVIEFEHRHKFESSIMQNPLTGEIEVAHWDGAVIEYSLGNDGSWSDITDLGVDPGYRGQLQNDAENPLGGRNAIIYQNDSWPEMEKVSLNFGDKLAGQEIKIRFRLGTDIAAGDDGWDIDNLTFSGIENTPFATLGPQTGRCRGGELVDGGGGGCQSTSGGTTWPVLLGFLASLVALRRRRDPTIA